MKKRDEYRIVWDKTENAYIASFKENPLITGVDSDPLTALAQVLYIDHVMSFDTERVDIEEPD